MVDDLRSANGRPTMRLTCASQSDAVAWLEDLYRRYGAAVFRRCRRMLGTDAEDAVHEVFLRVAAGLEAAPRSTEAGFWIQRIARNYCLNELRTKRRRPEFQEDLEAEGPAAADHAAELVAARDLLRRLLSRVPGRVTATAWLHHVEGLTQDEVAGALGLSRRTVTTYLADLRERAIKVYRADQ